MVVKGSRFGELATAWALDRNISLRLCMDKKFNRDGKKKQPSRMKGSLLHGRENEFGEYVPCSAHVTEKMMEEKWRSAPSHSFPKKMLCQR